jgi:hypothetical protein
VSSAATETPRQVKVAKFIQIASGQPYGQSLIMFALDEAGVVWQQIVGRDNEWQPLPSKRGRPASP